MVPYQSSRFSPVLDYMISAVLDNATLTAIEINAQWCFQDYCCRYGLLIAGGMLIPGNIPTSSQPAG